MPTIEPTARQRAIAFLREHPEGMSKNELRQAVGGNSGAFRRLLQSMEDRGEITIHIEDRPNCGPTKVHRVAAPLNVAEDGLHAARRAGFA